MTRPVVLAFGGNALLPDTQNPTIQEERSEAFADAIRKLLPSEAGMALVHGNGPQVGMILLRIEATRDRIPPETLDILVAETQGSIGYLLARALRRSLPEREIAAVLTQVIVDRDDLEFDLPTKPIGPFYSEEVAGVLRSSRGWTMMKIPGRGWRRAVPSPRPLKIVEMHTIEDAIGHGHVVVAGGGGGIPVAKVNGGQNHGLRTMGLKGVEAVVDKDLTASLLATELEARRLIILTDVPNVITGFGKPSQRPIESMGVGTARRLLEGGEFPPGSMGPKVEAALNYVQATGQRALITDLEHLEEALSGEAGTWVESEA